MERLKVYSAVRIAPQSRTTTMLRRWTVPELIVTQKTSFYVIFIALILSDCVAAARLAPVIWSASDPLFSSHTDPHIEAVSYDSIDFLCPYRANISSHDNINLNVYRVDRQSYLNCDMRKSKNPYWILHCNENHRDQIITMVLRPLGVTPNSPSYQPGQDYFFISTSTGKPGGDQNKVGGLCSSHNMKLSLTVQHVPERSRNSSQSVNPGKTLEQSKIKSNSSSITLRNSSSQGFNAAVPYSDQSSQSTDATSRDGHNSGAQGKISPVFYFSVYLPIILNCIFMMKYLVQ